MAELLNKLRSGNGVDGLSREEIDSILEKLNSTETQQSMIDFFSKNPELLTELSQNIENFNKSKENKKSSSDDKTKDFSLDKLLKDIKNKKIDQKKLTQLLNNTMEQTMEQTMEPKDRLKMKLKGMRQNRMGDFSKEYQNQKKKMHEEQKKEKEKETETPLTKKQKQNEKRKMKRLEQKMGEVSLETYNKVSKRLRYDADGGEAYNGDDERHHDQNIVKLYKLQSARFKKELELDFSDSESEQENDSD
jgi:hypothetical protein